jgi:hypothetical protein
VVLSHIGYVDMLHVLLAYISLVPHWLCRYVACSLAYINRPIMYIILCDSIYNISFYTNAKWPEGESHELRFPLLEESEEPTGIAWELFP